MAQTTTLIDPATDGSFEGTHGWMLVNSSTHPNRWCVGSAAPPSAGNSCLYISNSPTCNTYQYSSTSGTGGGTTYVYAYKQITVPAGQPYVRISLKAKVDGEHYADCAIIYLTPATTSITSDVALSSVHELFALSQDIETYRGYVVSEVDYTFVSHVACVDPGTYQFVIGWKSDNLIEGQPPASIDEVSVVSSAIPFDPDLGTGVTNVSTVPYTHPTAPSPTTCGSGKDLFGFNVKDRCSFSKEAFNRGEDRVWTFTPTQGGCVRVQFTGDTINGDGWKEMILLIYEDNPLSCGRCLRSSNNRKVHTHIFPVQAGRKYYVVLESNYGEGISGCDGFLGLTISAPDQALCTQASLSAATQGMSHFTVHPNPASEAIQINATGLEVGRAVQLRLRDALGRTVLEAQTFPNTDGKLSYSLRLPQLPTGLYTLELRQGGVSAMQRLSIAP
jgi:hypothetical protein